MQPLPRPHEGSSADGEKLHPAFEITQLRALNSQSNFPKAHKARLFANNPHLSFLLSRIGAYPFSFVQQPNILGRDVMAGILDKNENAAWFVAPLVVARQKDWSNKSTLPKKGKPPQKEEQHRRLVAFLTFDTEPSRSVSAPELTPEIRKAESELVDNPETWEEFQTDLLHQMDLFSACLAQKKCFRDLVSNEPPF